MFSKVACTFVVLFVIFSGTSARDDSPKFEKHFKHLSQVRHPFFREGKPWMEAREYIMDRFREYGIKEVEQHKFNTTVTATGAFGITEEVEGINIIGVVEGLDKTGPVMVIGADYDTTLKGDPFRNNGGGVACLLEALHLFDDSIRRQYHQNFTIVFVAFDLNTREYFAESEGHPGSYYFVREWLEPFLNGIHPKEFRGAVILDSVTVYNTMNNSQSLAPGFNDAFPQAYQDIEQRGAVGNFLGFVYRNIQRDNEIIETFVNNYNKERRFYPFRLQEMNLHLNVSTATEEIFDTINHQAQYNFWADFSKPLPAFLLFDTDNYRTDPNPYECDDNGCSVRQFLTKERELFLMKTTNTLVNTMLELQTTPRKERRDDTEDSGTIEQISAMLFATSLLLTVAQRLDMF